VAAKRTSAVAVTAAVLTVNLGLGGWQVVHLLPSDCDTVHHMLAYSHDEDERLAALVPELAHDPHQLLDAFRARSATLKRLVDSIGKADLRAKAEALVKNDEHIVDVWSGTIEMSATTSTDVARGGDADFLKAYASYISVHDNVIRSLQAACPGST
jgi:hypothetical protein